MSLEAALVSLRRELGRVQEAVSELRVTIVEDKPARGSVVLVDQLDTTVTDLASAIEEADARLAQVIPIGQGSASIDSARAAVRDAHELVNRFASLYLVQLAAHDRVAQLLEMGRERGREWRAWSQEVKTAIERCLVPMQAVNTAIVDCWGEIGERLARNSVSVQATNIGQQITVRDELLEVASKAS